LNEGDKLLKKDFNILKIVKDLRNIKIIIKSLFIDEETRYIVEHANRNIINLDNIDESQYLVKKNKIERKNIYSYLFDEEENNNLNKLLYIKF